MAFEDKKRLPIIPLSAAKAELARRRELLFDYSINKLRVKNEKNQILDPINSPALGEYVVEYMDTNPSIFQTIQLTLKYGASNVKKTIQQACTDIYNAIGITSAFEYKFAGSSSDGGPANSADKLNHSIKFNKPDGTSASFNGFNQVNLDIDTMNFMKEGTMTTLGTLNVSTFTLAENVSYGKTDPPSGASEGQIYIKLIEEI